MVEQCASMHRIKGLPFDLFGRSNVAFIYTMITPGGRDILTRRQQDIGLFKHTFIEARVASFKGVLILKGFAFLTLSLGE